MNEIGRHVTLAIVKYQIAGRNAADLAMISRDIDKNVASYYQGLAAIEYATARKLMGVE